jgi:transcriptional regulator of acetoin/glycerol metabolism
MGDHSCFAESTAELYRLLIDLPLRPELEPLLQRILELLVELSGGELAHLELADARTAVQLAAGRAPTADEEILRRDAIAFARDREPLVTEPLPRHALPGVLCVPIGPRGAIFLQSATEFTAADRERAQLVVRVLAPRAADVLERAAILRAIDAHQGNIAASARALGMARSQIYKLMAHYAIRRETAQAA